MKSVDTREPIHGFSDTEEAPLNQRFPGGGESQRLVGLLFEMVSS